jgi:uncharacterized protein YjbI with pentapeptide repeats
MASFEHLAILNRGVEVWNKWRDESPEIMPDLVDSHLSGRNLERANLSRVVANGANFADATLSHSDFSEAELVGGNLLRTKVQV